MKTEVKNIVIVGGGTSGWMTATGLAHFLKNKHIHITLIESSEIEPIGVGEATLPAIRDFNAAIGIDEIDFIRKTQATFKLGIKFENWRKKGESFFHPFSSYGSQLNGVDFHHYVNKLNAMGHQYSLSDFSISAQLAKAGRFAQPNSNPSSSLADYHYAFHFDASLYAKYLRNIALNQGVTCHNHKVTSVSTDNNSGHIQSLTLDNNSVITGDLFIDCTGFKGLLIEETLKTGYEDWSKYLLCNSAAVVQSDAIQSPPPYTLSKARSCGWQWAIPLQGRTGNGYVYSNNHMSDDEAIHSLKSTINGGPLNEARILNFTTGRRKKYWNKNCIALGLAGGLIEPLESTNISMVQTGLFRLLHFFPHNGFNEADINEANRLSQKESELIRDFIILHYHASQRDDSAFWRDVTNTQIPVKLAHKIQIFKRRGHIIMHEGESFQTASWLSLYNGFNVQPELHDMRADAVNVDQLVHSLDQMKASIQQAASAAIPHHKFIHKHCSIDSSKD